jgi:curved DNA-binding protein CbpA
VKSLTDDNPYDILGLDLNADKKAIKQAFSKRSARRSRGRGQDRRRLRQAYDLLRSPEKRIIVDALTPSFADDFDGDQLVAEFCDGIAENPNWLAYLDRSTILKQDLQALIEATLRYTFTELPEPQRQPGISTEFDGLDDFLREWLG